MRKGARRGEVKLRVGRHVCVLALQRALHEQELQRHHVEHVHLYRFSSASREGGQRTDSVTAVPLPMTIPRLKARAKPTWSAKNMLLRFTGPRPSPQMIDGDTMYALI